MKKIILLRSNPKDAAFERVARMLADAYIVECCLWDRQGDHTPAMEHPHVKYRKFRLRAGYHSAETFVKLLLFEAWLLGRLLIDRYDAIHAIDLDTGLAGWLIARLRNKPIVYHCLDPYSAALPSSWPNALGRTASRLENFVISRADLFVITDLLRMPQHEGAQPKDVLEIANAPDIGMPENGTGKETPFTVGYIGSLIEGRNLSTIVEAMGEMADDGIRLIIGGFGPLENDIRNLCRSYGNVEFIGWVPYQKVLEIEQTFDVLLHITDRGHPGQKYVSPNKLFESMALGKPIVAGEGTLTAERIARIGNGVAIPYGSKRELQKTLRYLKGNPDIAREMGQQGRKEYDQQWRPDIMRKRLLDAYQKLLGP